MSYQIAEEFLRRAKEYLRAAELTLYQGLYEVSALSSEVSAQLSLKALLYKLGVDPPRTHAIRELLSLVYAKTGEIRIAEFTKERRERLIILENVRGKSQYGLPPVSRDEAEIAFTTAKEILELVESLWNL